MEGNYGLMPSSHKKKMSHHRVTINTFYKIIQQNYENITS
jgi:hypothetical protein